MTHFGDGYNPHCDCRDCQYVRNSEGLRPGRRVTKPLWWRIRREAIRTVGFDTFAWFERMTRP